MRIAELNRYLNYRYGCELPDDDAGRADLEIMVSHLVRKFGEPFRWVWNFASHRARWMPDAELRAMTNRAVATPKKWRADTLGRALRLTMGERTKLAITTIRAFDQTKEQLEQARREQRRKADEKRRRAKGIKPRADYLAEAGRKRKEREAQGVSRATHYRRLRQQKAAAAAKLHSETSPRPARELTA